MAVVFRVDTRQDDLHKTRLFVCFKIPEYGLVFRKKSPTGWWQVWLWQATVRDYEPLYQHSLLQLYYKTSEFNKFPSKGRALPPASVLGLGKKWAPGGDGGLHRGWGWRGSRHLGLAVPAELAGFRGWGAPFWGRP